MSEMDSQPTKRFLSDSQKESIRSAFTSLKENIAGFVPRRQQNLMISEAARVLGHSGGIGAVEAKTGTGKSLAYLVAAVPIALATKKKLVISTGTVALQEQLFDRDIPAFMRATGLELKVALGKGRGRYVCARNLSGLMRTSVQTSLDLDAEPGWPRPPQQRELEAVRDLKARFESGGWNGDLDRIGALPPEIQRLVTVAPGSCTGSRCPFARKCPVLAARRELKEAELLVVNHDLLLAELRNADGDGNGVIDSGETLFVIDEGHQLAEKAISADASQLHLPGVGKMLDELKRQLMSAYRVAGKERIGGVDRQQMVELVDAAFDALEKFEAQLRLDIAGTANPGGDRDAAWRGRLGEVPANWRNRAIELKGTMGSIEKLVDFARDAIRSSSVESAVIERAASQLGIAGDRVERAFLLFEAWAETDDAAGMPTARWISRNDTGGLTLHASPVSGGRLLDDLLWSKGDSVLLTSATLTNGGCFRSFVESMGLPETAQTLCLPSPFDLEQQASIHVPWVKALPSDHEGHAKVIASWLDANLDWADTTAALVLFTSKAKMARTLDLLSPERRAKVLVQGSMAKASLLTAHGERIKSGEGSVIFGLNGFGEGLDLPGRLLTTVLITQLPFAVPSEPVLATLAEWYEENGRNPFAEISIPDAIRVLTQFCGRLIRSVTDKGRIVVLDRRLIEKRYGAEILAALPPFRREIGRRQH